MRYLLFTDVHGNNEALNSVLDFAKGQSIDHYLFLGDMVGYGASPAKSSIKSDHSIPYP